jgi:GAF domain
VFEQTWDLMVAHRNTILRELEAEFRLSRQLVKMRTEHEVLKSRAEECSRRAMLTTDPQIHRDLLDFAAQWLELGALQQVLAARRDSANVLGSGNKASVKILKDRQAWLSGQRQAFEMAMLGRELETTLGILIRTASTVIGGGVRAAFYLANAAGTTLHHVVGMPLAYAEAVDGFKIGADSLACGLAAHMGRPVLTADIASDPRWLPWRRMADQFDYRGCWSFPIRAGLRNGSFAIYSKSLAKLLPPTYSSQSW